MRQLKIWSAKQTQHWSTRTRLWIALSASNCILLIVILLTNVRIPYLNSMSIWVQLALTAPLVLSFVGTLIILELFIFRKMGEISRILEDRASSSKPYPVLETRKGDEFGRLIDAVNSMGTLYQNSFRTLARRADELATLNRVAETINRTLDLQEVFDVSLRGVLRAVDWDIGAVYMLSLIHI